MADTIATARVVPGLDPPTLADHRRLRRARRVARSRLLGSDPTDADLRFAVFREEFGAVIRSASPLVLLMLAPQGMTLDEAVERMVPVGGWPIYPSLTGRFSHSLNSALPLRSSRTRLRRQLTEPRYHGLKIIDTGHDYVLLSVVDHSLDLNATIGPIFLQTRFGELCVEFVHAIPDALLAGCAGRRVGDVVDHEAWRGRDWMIAAVGPADLLIGRTLYCATGTIDYRVPWVR